MRPQLGTFVTIRANGGAACLPGTVAAAVESAFSTINRVEQLMSFHRRASDIGRLNRARPGRYVKVHRWTFSVLRKALELSEVSGGTFDCNIGQILVKAGLLPRSRTAAARRRQPMGKAISLIGNGLIQVNHRVSLDLGGIAKGFAVDQAVRTLRNQGMRGGVVNAGGDLRTFGPEPQPIWVRCPAAPGERRLMGYLRNGAVATSASYFTHKDRSGGVDGSAIINTATERQIALTGSVSVIAKTCMLADGLTKIWVLRRRIPASLRLQFQVKVITL